MIRRLTLTEEQYQAVMYALDDVSEVYACSKEDEFETKDEWQTCVKTGDILVELYNGLIDNTEGKLGGDTEAPEIERLYFKYKDSIDRDWSTIGCWMLEAIPTTTTEIEEEILQAEYGLDFDQIDDLESEESDGLPWEQTWEYKRSMVSNAVAAMLKDSLYY